MAEAGAPDMEAMKAMMAGMGGGGAPGGGDDPEGDSGGEDGDGGEGAPDMSNLMSMLGGKGGGGGPGGGMDMSAMMSMLGGMGGGGGMGGMGGGMGGMGGMMGGKGGGMGGKGAGGGEDKDEGEKAAADGKYHWQQKGEEIQVRFPSETALTKKDVSVKFKRASLQVTVQGVIMLDGALKGTVEVDECTWCLAPGGTELQVMLTKQSEGDWASLMR
ncbi:unnamed protein product [Polarella glacialis]|uniref:CS domain-containing protein n=1 Tax=Polarella glacialis TaxID=89957 RepID=A0A813JRJ3_POLGL|nr:unnamed protein product [Polarella glacialis]